MVLIFFYEPLYELFTRIVNTPFD